jgi:hypothetical protein
MTLNQTFKNYALNDGRIAKFDFDFNTKELNIELEIRKRIIKEKFEPCKILLTFSNVKLLDILEDFPTDGQYSDITILEVEDNSIYASFDPYGNSGLPNEQDNWIIRAGSLSILESNFE